MGLSVSDLLSERIQFNCNSLYESGQFKHAAIEAMLQVELAIKEKAKLGSEAFGQALIQKAFKGHQGVILKVPLGDARQATAQKYFESVFSYYRNYSAHDGALIDERISLRIMIVASELLDLLNESALSLSDHGGAEGIVRIVECGSTERLFELLDFFDEYWMPSGVYEKFFEELFDLGGYTEQHVEALLTLNLIRMEEVEYPSETEPGTSDSIEAFTLTEFGRQVRSQEKCL